MTKPLRDRKYLDSYRDAACIVCGRRGQDDVVGAHIRWGQEGGVGLKPGDDLTLPLCGSCHGEQHEIGEKLFWCLRLSRSTRLTMLALKALARERYREWKNDQS